MKRLAILFFIGTAVVLLLDTAQNIWASEQPAAIKLETAFPVITGIDPAAGLPQFARYIFVLGLGLGGILAFAMIVFAGLEWSLSGANPSLQQDAKDRIFNAVFGLLLLLGSFVILNTINPALVSLRPAGHALQLNPVKIRPAEERRAVPDRRLVNRVTNCYLFDAYECIGPLVPDQARGTVEDCRDFRGHAVEVGLPMPIERWENAALDCGIAGAGGSCLRRSAFHNYCGRLRP